MLKSTCREQKSTKQEQEAFQGSKINLGLLNKLTGVVVVDEKIKILLSNQSFINLLGSDAEVAEVIPGLVGADLKLWLHHIFITISVSY